MHRPTIDISATDEIKQNQSQTINWSSVSWPCYHCDEIFNDYKSFSDHQNYTHQIVKVQDTCYQCYICGEPIFKYIGLLNHIRSVHSDVLKLCCDVCNSNFPNYEELSYHRDEHIEEADNIHPSIYHCSLCEMVHASEQDLKNHIQQTHGLEIVSSSEDSVERTKQEKHFCCDICSKTYVYKKDLLAHIRTHTNPIICGCGRYFSSKGNLKRHIKNNPEGPNCSLEALSDDAGTETKTLTEIEAQQLDDHQTSTLEPCKEKCYKTQTMFQCGECFQNVKSDSELTDHKRTHKNDQTHQNHMLIHTDGRAYKCELCPKTFHYKTSFDAHIRTHAGGSAYKCKFCQKSLYSMKKLTDHESLHTGEYPFVCDVCPEKFKTYENFQIHMNAHPVHPHTCDVCNKGFYHKKSLAVHQRICQGSPQPLLAQDLANSNDRSTNNPAFSPKESTEKKKYSYMSRRQRKTNHGVSDFNVLVNAIKEVKLRFRKAFTVAREYQIPHASFYRYIAKLDKKNLDFTKLTEGQLLKAVKEVASFSTHHMVFKDDEEEALIAYIMRCCSHYYGLSTIELRQLAYQFARKIQKKYPESWDEHQMAGFSWYYAFLDRHQNLLLRTPEQTNKSRIKSFCRENVEVFFKNLQNILNGTPFKDVSIYNMDDIGFSTCGQVISLKEAKCCGKIAEQDYNNVATMVLAVSAAGNSIPPLFLFPRKNMLNTFMEGTQKNAVGIANETGWMQQSEFLNFMKHFIEHSQSSKHSPTLLILDNHASHLSIEVLDMANENGVTILSFPPHCSHRMQPLDISVFSPLKSHYTYEYQNWFLANDAKPFELRHIAGLVTAALEKILAPESIAASFKSVGIHPFNPDVFTDADFAQAKLSGENAGITTVEKEYDEMEQRRICISTD